MSSEDLRDKAPVPIGSRRNPRANILVVEDDEAIAQMVVELLEADGYRVWSADSGRAAKAMLEEIRADLVILDLVLPDVDGLVLCTDIKAQYDLPIIICSATTRKRDAILGLRLGADDFVAKPFDAYDLEARVEAVLRRVAQRRETQPSAEPDHYRIGDLVVDRYRRRVTLGGDELQLTPTEYRLLSALASRPDEVLTRDELAQLVWGYQDASSGRAIDVHIRRLRVKLDSAAVPPPPIISVRGFGYKIVRHNHRSNQTVA
jgi:two-component system, OmpR family, response regulator MtrA